VSESASKNATWGKALRQRNEGGVNAGDGDEEVVKKKRKGEGRRSLQSVVSQSVSQSQRSMRLDVCMVLKRQEKAHMVRSRAFFSFHLSFLHSASAVLSLLAVLGALFYVCYVTVSVATCHRAPSFPAVPLRSAPSSPHAAFSVLCSLFVVRRTQKMIIFIKACHWFASWAGIRRSKESRLHCPQRAEEKEEPWFHTKTYPCTSSLSFFTSCLFSLSFVLSCLCPHIPPFRLVYHHHDYHLRPNFIRKTTFPP